MAGLELTLAGLVGAAGELAGRLGLRDGDRVLVTEESAAEAGPVVWLLAPLTVGASLVVCRHPASDQLKRRADAEGVTATLGVGLDGIRELGRPPRADPPSHSMDGGRCMDKVVASAAEAVADIGSGSSLAVGGFGLCGGADQADRRTPGAGCGPADHDQQQLRRRRRRARGAALRRRITRTISSFVGGNKELARLYLSGSWRSS